jgi:AcrR family transcriptional regulator
MVTKVSELRNTGRPRRFQDEDVFRAASEVIASSGFARLTLAAVAANLGCTKQALIKRFGSRHGLILAHLTWVTDESAAAYERLRLEYDSPLAAFRAGYVWPSTPEQVEQHNPAGYANLLMFGIEAGLDPTLRAEFERRERIYHDNLVESVRDSVAAGELHDCDADEIAFLLLTAGSGAMVRWIANPVGSPSEVIARVFDGVLGHLIISGSTHVLRNDHHPEFG